jgi:hypothetical protein
MADDTIKDPPVSEPHVRWRRSAETLATTPSHLPTALTEFAGLPAPSGPLADNLITHTLDTLDALVPIGTLKTPNDLVDATKDIGFETIPPTPAQIASAQSRINDDLSRLAPTELQSAANQLSLRPATMEWGTRVTLIRERRLIRQQARELLAEVDFDEVGYLDSNDDHQHTEDVSFGSTVKAVVHSLRTQQPSDWNNTFVDSLRCAVALHLAQIGDAFLQPPRLPDTGVLRRTSASLRCQERADDDCRIVDRLKPWAAPDQSTS